MALKGKLMAMAHMPTDVELLAAAGRVTIRHAFLDWTLNRTIKTITRMTPDQADFAFAGEHSASLRAKVLHVAVTKFGEDHPAYAPLAKLMDRCKRATKRRNETTHHIWVEVNGKTGLLELKRKHELAPLPTAQELNDLAERIQALSQQLNEARLKGGFLFAAAEEIHKKEKAKKANAKSVNLP